jgi:hypothetical protein
MKKIVILLGVFLVAGVAFAADPLTPLNYQFPIYGTPVDNTIRAVIDNTATSIKTLAAAAGITWLRNGQPPQGALISVETKDARFGNSTIVSGLSGHILAVGSSIHIGGAGFIDALYFTSSVLTDNTGVVQITLER